MFYLPYSNSEEEGARSPSSKSELATDEGIVMKNVFDENFEDVSPLYGHNIEIWKEE